MVTAKPRISIRITEGIAEVVVVGCLDCELGRDWFHADDLHELRRSAKWLGVPAAEVYDRLLAARGREQVAA
jgi:hypothetical protein